MALCEPPTLGVVNEESVQDVVKGSCREVNGIAKECKKTNVAREGSVDLRRKRLMEENDCGKIWKAIDWKDEISSNEGSTQPTESQFKIFFEELLNPLMEEVGEVNFEQAPSIPIVDDPFTFREVETAVSGIN